MEKTTIILVTSEAAVKQTTAISENTAGKYMRAAMLDAQEVALKRIIGSCLLEKLKNLIASDEIALPENGIYADTLDKIAPYMAYQTAVELAFRLSYKFANIGVHKTRDEGVDNATFDEIVSQKAYYQAKADAAAIEMQKWLLKNKGAIPELDCCCCAAIEANLRDAVTCAIFLGGRRGVR